MDLAGAEFGRAGGVAIGEGDHAVGGHRSRSLQQCGGAAVGWSRSDRGQHGRFVVVHLVDQRRAGGVGGRPPVADRQLGVGHNQHIGPERAQPGDQAVRTAVDLGVVQIRHGQRPGRAGARVRVEITEQQGGRTPTGVQGGVEVQSPRRGPAQRQGPLKARGVEHDGDPQRAVAGTGGHDRRQDRRDQAPAEERAPTSGVASTGFRGPPGNTRRDRSTPRPTILAAATSALTRSCRHRSRT